MKIRFVSLIVVLALIMAGCWPDKNTAEGQATLTAQARTQAKANTDIFADICPDSPFPIVAGASKPVISYKNRDGALVVVAFYDNMTLYAKQTFPIPGGKCAQ